MAKNTTEEEVIIDVEARVDDTIKSTDELVDSITELTKANKMLREERNKLNLNTEQGRKLAAKLNAEIDKNTKVIRDNSSAMEKQRFNIGNYTGALDKLVPGLGSTINGIKSFNSALWTLVANPVGAVLAAIVAVIALVYAAVQRTTGGMDKFEQVTAVLAAGLKVLIDRLARVGEGLIKLFSGDIIGGLEEIGKSMTGIGDEMQREIELAYELEKAIQALEDSEIAYEIAAAETTNTIKELILQSKNRTLTEAERIAKLEQASNLEEKLNKQDLANKIQAIKNATTQAELDDNANQAKKKATESEYEYGKRLLESGTLIDANRDAVKEALLAYQSSIGESIALQEKLQNSQDALFEKQMARLEKEAAQRKKLQEEEAARLRELIALRIEIFEEEINRGHDAVVKAEEERIKFRDGVNKYLDDANEKRIVRAEKAAEQEKKIEKLKNQALIGGTKLVTAEKSNARVVLNTLFKQDALKETYVNTKAAAIAAYKSLAGIPIVGPVLGAAAATLVTVYGLTQAAGIAGINFFARGGKVGDKRGTFTGRSHSQGGEDYVNTRTGHRINVEGDENFYVLKRSASREINALSAMNVKHGGRSFYTTPASVAALGGQIETRTAAGNASSAREIERIVAATVANMPPSIVLVEDIRTGVERQVTVEDGAKVL